MRTPVVIDGELLKAVLRAPGLEARRDAVAQGLRTLRPPKPQAELRKLRGRCEGVGDPRPMPTMPPKVAAPRGRHRLAALCCLLALLPAAAAAQPASAPPAPPAPTTPPAASAPASATLLDRVRALGLHHAADDARLPTWHPEGLDARAAALRALVADAMTHYRAALGIADDPAAPLQLAVLTRAQWAQVIRHQPYGIPGVAGRPPVIFMPAGDDGLAADDALALLRDEGRVAAATLRALADAGFDAETAARRHVDLVGLHELGHVYAQRFGIHAPARWLDELAASYFAYAYLRAHRPALARLWDGVLQAYLDAVQPAHRSLADFDRLYFGVGAQLRVVPGAVPAHGARGLRRARAGLPARPASRVRRAAAAAAGPARRGAAAAAAVAGLRALGRVAGACAALARPGAAPGRAGCDGNGHLRRPAARGG